MKERSDFYTGLVLLHAQLCKLKLSIPGEKSLWCDHSMEATEQYFPVVLFIMLYKVVLTFESVDEILKCNHSNESY